MTAPTPPQQPSPYSTTKPDPNTIAAIVDIGHRERDAAELRLKSAIQRHRVLLVCIAIAVAFAGWRGYVWHLKNLAKLEAENHEVALQVTTQSDLGKEWKKIAQRREDSLAMRVSVVTRLITHTKVDTLLVPAAPVAAQDGVTYSETPPLVPMEVVSKLAFDSLGAACERVEHDCTSALAAKDSALAHSDSEAVALKAHDANTSKQLTIEKRTALWQKVAYGIVGLALGRVIR